MLIIEYRIHDNRMVQSPNKEEKKWSKERKNEILFLRERERGETNQRDRIVLPTHPRKLNTLE